MKKWLPILICSLMVLTACGGGGTSSGDKAKIEDDDKDGIVNSQDNCPTIANANQLDTDNNGIGDACENINPQQQALEKISQYAKSGGSSLAPNSQDYNNAGVFGVTSENIASINQEIVKLTEDDADTLTEIQKVINDLGIEVPDSDGDSIDNSLDNCPNDPNPDQEDQDTDGKGNICDQDIDGDGVPNNTDEFPNDSTRATSVTSAHRLLTQASFGATEDEIDRVVRIGTDAWINEQLNLPSAYDSSTDNHKTHLERTIEIAKTVDPARDWYRDGIFNRSGTSRVAFYQMSDWWENALGHPTNTRHGSDQLRQRVAYALSQILVTSALDSDLQKRGESLAYYHDILTRNSFGNYRTILGEISRSATMGIYLSHSGNKKANPAKGTRPDENFARELIQLFAIGLYELNLDGSPNRDNNVESYPDAGDELVPSYTQDDVEEVAKVMTGWSAKGLDFAAPMTFISDHHEDEIAEGGDGNVTVMGSTFALNSGEDGSGMDSVLDLLFQHSNMGPFISQRLISNLVTSNPSSAYVARVASVFNDNGSRVKGDLKAVVQAILTDPEARDLSNRDKPNYGKLKEPILAWTQLLRTFRVTTVNGWKGSEDDNGNRVLVNGVYTYPTPEKDFGQAPFRSKSVFNFFKPDYVPSDTYFSSNRLVAPESQILTDQTQVGINNTFYNFLRRNEKNSIIKLSEKTLAEFASRKSVYSSYLMLIDFDKELEVFEQALDGDSNGDFVNMDQIDPSNNIPYKEKAVDALITRLNKVMLGNTMTAEYKAKLRHYLLNATGFRSSNDFKQAHRMIRDSIRFIVTSSAYMVQK